jgi:hypothetical protein
VTPCPSDLNLEIFLLVPERSGAGAHVTSCTKCSARLAEMRRLGEEFEKEVLPVTLRRATVAEPQRPRPRWRRWVVVASPIAAAAAAVAFLLLRDLRDPELSLAVLVDQPTGARVVEDGAAVPASASLRFQVHPRTPCSLWVLSVDAAGEIVRLYPPRGDKEAERLVRAPRREELPTGAVLDGRAGPQRIFAVCTRTPVPWNTVKQAAAQTLEKGDQAVRGFRSIPGLPPGATQTTVLLEKRS